MEVMLTAASLDSTCKASRISRKRVRFGAEGDAKRVKVRVVEVIRPSSEMSNSEKERAWYQKADYKGNLKIAQFIANAHGISSSLTHKQLELNYSGTLASTYASCYLDDSEHSELPDHCAQHLAVATSVEKCSVDGECNRGLEKITVPMVGRETVRRRKDAIGFVLLAQYALKQCGHPGENIEILRSISVEQTRCARKFAKALGTADAMSALLEYQDSEQHMCEVEAEPELNIPAARVA
jgi:hypothetical protein